MTISVLKCKIKNLSSQMKWLKDHHKIIPQEYCFKLLLKQELRDHFIAYTFLRNKGYRKTEVTPSWEIHPCNPHPNWIRICDLIWAHLPLEQREYIKSVTKNTFTSPKELLLQNILKWKEI